MHAWKAGDNGRKWKLATVVACRCHRPESIRKKIGIDERGRHGRVGDNSDSQHAKMEDSGG